MKDPAFYTRCTCSSELLSIEHDVEDGLFYLYIWRAAESSAPLSWKDRVRYAWRIFRTGRPYGDQIVLDAPSMKNMGKWIKKKVKVTSR